MRAGNIANDATNERLSALLATVCEHASASGLAPELPLPDAILIQRLVVQLSRAGRLFFAQNPLQRENAPASALSAPAPVRRNEPAQPEVAIGPQHPLQRETEDPGDRLSAWRSDHKTDRDQRVPEKPRTVIDERLIAKIEAMNRRGREE